MSSPLASAVLHAGPLSNLARAGRPCQASGDGNLCPVVLGLTRDAKAAWTEFYNCHAEEQNDLSGDLSAAWSKLEEYAARLALVIHCVRWAADDPDLERPDAIDADSMKAGIVLAEWFKAEARRVYPLLSESDDDREDRQLADWIERKGGSTTIRKLQQGRRKYKLSGQAEAALSELVSGGWGEWHDIPSGSKGGRPSREFRLYKPSTSTQPPKTRDSEGCVDVDSVDAPETQRDGEWGEL